jgi:hypothetical protein
MGPKMGWAVSSVSKSDDNLSTVEGSPRAARLMDLIPMNGPTGQGTMAAGLPGAGAGSAETAGTEKRGHTVAQGCLTRDDRIYRFKRENEALKRAIRTLRKEYRADTAQRQAQYRATIQRLAATIRRLTAENHRLRGELKREQ